MNLFEKQAQLHQLFAQTPVSAAYLAGSLANRTAFGQLSDVDIAILLMEQVKADQFLDYRLYFFSELAKRLESDTIDVVILNQTSLLFKSQVIKNGQILFSRDERQRVMFEAKAVMDYLDFKKFDDIQHQALSKRIYGQMPSTVALDKEMLQPALKRLREAVSILRELAKTQREEFVQDYHLYGLAEHYTLISVESCLYVCSILIASLGLRRPEDYHELLSIIAAQGLIPKTLVYRLEVLVNLRDTLLQGQEVLDRDILYDHLHHRLDDVTTFADTVGA